MIEEKTVQAITNGIDDLAKNKASRSEVISLIDERVKTDKEQLAALKTDLEKTRSEAEEIKAAAEEHKIQMRRLMGNNMSALKGPDGAYHGMFASPQEAKAFALLVMAGTLDHTKHHERSVMAVKELQKMGIEPYWLDTQSRKTMTGSSQTGGGALISVEQVASWITLLETYGVLRRNAQPMPMGAGQTTVPKTDTLLTGYVPGEGGTITASDPTIAVCNLVPKTICFLTAYSLELEEDSLVALGEFLGTLFARSATYYEDLCGFLGDGTSTYFGFKGIAGALKAVSGTIANIKSLVVGSGNAYSELALVDFEGCAGILPDYADDGSVKWFVHRYFYWTVMVKLALAAGGVNATEVVLGAGTRQKQYLGYPVEFTQVMPRAEANSQICALLANLRLGLILGTRGGLVIDQSTERYFEMGLVAARARNRVAINAHGVGDTTNAGPICGLITAAS
jgi:HK97 family phage major capsid protein